MCFDQPWCHIIMIAQDVEGGGGDKSSSSDQFLSCSYQTLPPLPTYTPLHDLHIILFVHLTPSIYQPTKCHTCAPKWGGIGLEDGMRC